MQSLNTPQSEYFSEIKESDSKALRNGFSINIDPLDATFRDSSRAPLHSWYPYLEGYSPKFVKSVLQEYLPNAKRIIEPFAGSGTTPITLGQLGIECSYSEANPVMAFIVQVKLNVLTMDFFRRKQLANRIESLCVHLNTRVKQAEIDIRLKESYESTFGSSIFFEETTYETVLRLRTLIDDIIKEDDDLAIVSL